MSKNTTSNAFTSTSQVPSLRIEIPPKPVVPIDQYLETPGRSMSVYLCMAKEVKHSQQPKRIAPTLTSGWWRCGVCNKTHITICSECKGF
ncbi:hypothetical protein BGX29_001197 [Mortierella sp. GBA35]|nr:hypothetical protein BGX29_001197 [Mortierella sp. GBA35]